MLKNWKVWLSVLIGAAALYLVLRGVDPNLLTQAVRRAEPIWALPALLCFAVSLVARAMRWSTLMGGTPFWTTFWANQIGYMLNMTLPLRMGEIGRAYVMGERGGVSVVRALSAVAVERLIDLTAVVVIFAICSQFIPAVAQFGSAARIATLAIAAGVMGFAALLWLAQPLETLFEKTLRTFKLPHEWALKRFRDVSASLDVIRKPRTLLLALTQTAVIWLTALAVQFFMMRMFLPATVQQAAFSMVMANLGGALPALPGGLGPAQLAAQQSLVLPFSVEENAAVAFVLINQFAQQGLLILIGLFALTRLGLKFNQVSRAGNAMPKTHGAK